MNIQLREAPLQTASPLDHRRDQRHDQRHLDLDWIRIGAFGLLILYHVGMVYVPWDFHVKSTPAGKPLEAVMLALNPWRLALLFLVSGAATRFMMRKLAAGALARRRATRLLLPLVFGMLVVVPPQAYVEVVEKYGFAGGFPRFYIDHYLGFHTFVTPGGGATGLILPTWNHLWFVLYLFVYTMLAAALMGFAPGAVGRAERWLDSMGRGRASAILLLVAPALALAAFRFWLLPRFPSTHALFGDWYNHAIYLLAFSAGFLLARAEGAWLAFERLRIVALAAAVVGYGGFMVLRELPMSDAIRAGRALLYGIDQWCAIVAVLGFGRRLLAGRDAPARLYLTNAVFAYYIIHQTAIVLAAHALKPLGLSIGLEALLAIAATGLACGAGYEIVRRIAWLRPLFGVPDPVSAALSRAPTTSAGLR